MKSIILVLSLSISFTFPAFSGNSQLEDSVDSGVKPSRAEELIRGERLFYGLVYLDNRNVNCAGCHNTRYSDTLNWNPTAVEISEKYLNRSNEDLVNVLLSPSGEKMSQVHKGFQLSPNDIRMLKSYMDKLTVIGLKPIKPVITKFVLFIFASLLFLLSLTDLLVIKKIKSGWIHSIILIVTISCITYILVVDALDVGQSVSYEPDQPVKFSHKVHAGQNGTDCIYCHHSVPYSKTAGVPSESICMNCHLLVRKGTRSGNFEIAKIIERYDSLKPVRWIRVYNLPDHVFFSHAQHVSAGGISCQKCHGLVETMDRIRINGKLTMGWCINCHRTTDINFNGNKFYTEYTGLAVKVRKGTAANVKVENIGGTQCMKCHY